MEDLILLLDDDGDLELTLDSYDDIVFETDAAVIPTHDHYNGDYVVVPILHNDQVLETYQKLMDDNITVKPIPVVQTSNVYGGKTVVIG